MISSKDRSRGNHQDIESATLAAMSLPGACFTSTGLPTRTIKRKGNLPEKTKKEKDKKNLAALIPVVNPDCQKTALYQKK